MRSFDWGTVLGGDGVLVDGAVEPVGSAYRGGWRGRDGPCWRAGFGGCEAERAVRPMAVLVLSELAQHAVRVTAVGDQQPVEALPSDAADESLSDRVCLRRPDRRADHTDTLGAEHRVKGARELAVVVADQKLQRSLALREREHEVPRLLGRPRTVGVLAHADKLHAPG